MESQVYTHINPTKKPVMKNLLIIVALATLVAACGGPKISEKQAELEKLKKEKTALDTKIAKLQDEVDKSDTTHKQKLIEVLTMSLTPKIFKTYIEVQGRIDADENVSLTTELPGTVTKINVKVGDHVSKGQVLAETDTRNVQQQLAVSQASVALATQLYEKQKSLWDQKIGTEVQYLQAKTMKEAGEASMSAIQEQLRMSKIISPIDGTVDLVNLKIGQATQPGNGVISVVNFENMKVKAAVAETYASRVKNGNEVLVLFPDMKDSVTSTVHYASRGIDALTRTFAVEVLLDGNHQYHPNTVAKLKINDFQSEKPELVVPVKYVQKGTDESYVMVIENGTAIKKTITIGREYSGNAEVLSGLKAGDEVVTDGYDLVNDGNKVTVKK